MALARGEASHRANYLLQASLQLSVAIWGPSLQWNFYRTALGASLTPAAGMGDDRLLKVSSSLQTALDKDPSLLYCAHNIISKGREQE